MSVKRRCRYYFQRAWRFFVDFLTDVIFGFIFSKKHDPLPPIKDSILRESATSLAAKIRTRQLKSKDVIESFIARIKEVNPVLNAMVEDNFKEALEEAEKVDEFIASGKKSEKEIERDTPFLGVPYTAKDSLQVKGMHTTCGLVSRKDKISEEDSEIIKQMRKSGAIFLGHTNTPEICMWWETYNNVYGRTNNPYNPNKTVGGSSGGEGAIITSAGSVIGIGSDLAGSIRIPCFFNGIFGHKPTNGIVNDNGHLPSLSGVTNVNLCIGPMCRYATDLLGLLKVMAASNLSKLKLDTKVDVGTLRYFYMENNSGASRVSKVNPAISKALRKAVKHFEKTYKVKAINANLRKLKYSHEMWWFKISSGHNFSCSQYLTEHQGELNGFLELAKWCTVGSNFSFPSIMLLIQEKFENSKKETAEFFIKQYDQLTREIKQLLGDNGVLFYPTHPRPAPYHYQPFFMGRNVSYTSLYNVLGFPSTHIPLGLNEEGLPVGIQVIANMNNDHLCLAIACELERAFGGWIDPSLPI